MIKILLQILNFLLFPIVLFFSVIGSMSLMTAISAPSLLLIAFICFSITIYYYLSFKLVQNFSPTSIQITKKRLDWIKVNAVVTSIFFLYLIFSSLSLISSSNLKLRTLVEQAFANLPTNMQDKEITTDQLIDIFRNIGYALIIISILFIIHVIGVFSILKKSSIEEEDRM